MPSAAGSLAAFETVAEAVSLLRFFRGGILVADETVTIHAQTVGREGRCVKRWSLGPKRDHVRRCAPVSPQSSHSKYVNAIRESYYGLDCLF
jgi:hypothetical protein